MKKTLLEKAKEQPYTVRAFHNIQDQEVEVFLALLKGEITMRQASLVLYPDKKGESRGYMPLYSGFCRGIRLAYEKGKLKVIK